MNSEGYTQNPASLPLMDDRFRALRAWLGTALPDAAPRIEPASADASFRRYFRVFLGDGRILADENRANNGIWNRIVLIDETRGHKQYVVSGANHYSQIPGTNDYIVDVVSGASGHDIARVSIPPPAD